MMLMMSRKYAGRSCSSSGNVVQLDRWRSCWGHRLAFNHRVVEEPVRLASVRASSRASRFALRPDCQYSWLSSSRLRWYRSSRTQIAHISFSSSSTIFRVRNRPAGSEPGANDATRLCRKWLLATPALASWHGQLAAEFYLPVIYNGSLAPYRRWTNRCVEPLPSRFPADQGEPAGIIQIRRAPEHWDHQRQALQLLLRLIG